MRFLPVALALFPTISVADIIPLTSEISQVVLYPSGAKITREVHFAAPGGRHVLQFLDLPHGTPMETLRVKVGGATMGAITMRENYVPPRGDTESPAVKSAEAAIEALEDAIAQKTDLLRVFGHTKEAADVRIDFLRQLGDNDALGGMDVSTLRDLSRMISDETLAARGLAVESAASTRPINREIAELKKDLSDARQALAALVPDTTQRNLVEVEVNAPSSIEGKVTLTYNHWNARWAPVYDIRLTSGDTPRIDIERSALVFQSTGENWQDVSLILSTNRPSGQSEPGQLWPDLRRISPPAAPKTVSRQMLDASQAVEEAQMGRMADPVLEAPVIVGSAEISEFSVTYTYPDKVDLASAADETRIPLGKLSETPTLVAQAVPRRDQTAFLVADFSNESGEMMLPSSSSQFFLDGEFIGSRTTPHVAAGADTQLSFGPINGLRLTRVVDRNEGDRGVLTRSNEQTERARLSIENLTAKAWPVRLLDQVPYSEQEDLAITWTARPRPTQQDIDDRKGVLAWEFNLDPGQTTTIDLDHKLLWPEGQILR